MKYFSELLNKPFDTEAECLEAEKEYTAQQKKIQKQLEQAMAEKKAKEEALNKSKKEMAKAIEDATKEKEEALKLYEVARQKAAAILEESNKEVQEILDAANVKVRAAEQKRLDAVIAFNKKFGTYTTTLTGTQAAEEYAKTMKIVDNTFSDILKRLFRF